MGSTLPLIAGLVIPKVPIKITKYNFCRTHFGYCNAGQIVINKALGSNVRYTQAVSYSSRYSASAVRSHIDFRSSNYLPEEPFWLSLINGSFRAIKSLFNFLHEQPGQLKYIEWPSFQSTLKTASLTLVLVAVLIVALASVDSTLCFLLNLLLRKAP